MSFRQFGGTTFAAKNNIVSNKYNTSNNLLVTQNVGQPNSFINFESDISANFLSTQFWNSYNNTNDIINNNLGNVKIFNNLDVSGNIDISGNITFYDISNNNNYFGSIEENSTIIDVSGSYPGGLIISDKHTINLVATYVLVNGSPIGTGGGGGDVYLYGGLNGSPQTFYGYNAFLNNIDISGNIVFSTGSSGITFNDGSQLLSSTYIVFVNASNTFISSQTFSDTVTFSGNTVTFSGNTAVTFSDTVTFSNNNTSTDIVFVNANQTFTNNNTFNKSIICSTSDSGITFNDNSILSSANDIAFVNNGSSSSPQIFTGYNEFEYDVSFNSNLDVNGNISFSNTTSGGTIIFSSGNTINGVYDESTKYGLSITSGGTTSGNLNIDYSGLSIYLNATNIQLETSVANGILNIIGNVNISNSIDMSGGITFNDINSNHDYVGSIEENSVAIGIYSGGLIISDNHTINLVATNVLVNGIPIGGGGTQYWDSNSNGIINNNSSGNVDVSNNLTVNGTINNSYLYLDTTNFNLSIGSSITDSNSGYNTVVGYEALNATNTGYNTAVGYQALNINTNTTNTAIGCGAGSNDVNGSHNTYLGGGTDASGGPYTYSTAIGSTALITESNQIMMGTSSINVYIPGTINSLYLNTYNSTSNNIIIGPSAYTGTGTDNTVFGNNGGGGTFNTVFGNALNANITGYGNTAIGYGALNVNTGSGSATYYAGYNTVIGYNALTQNTSGGYNTAIGYLAGTNDIDGSCNTYLGAVTGETSNSFNYSTAIGYSATITASNQIMMGGSNGSVNPYPTVYIPGNLTVSTTINSLYLNYDTSNNLTIISPNNTTIYGADNTAIGHNSMPSITSGNDNTAIGSGAMYSIVDGVSNTAIGYRALYKDTNSYNTAIGYQTLYTNVDGSCNTAIGGQALFNNISTNGVGSNTAIGYNSGYNDKYGYNNTYIGYNTGPTSSTTYNNSTAIGTNAIITASDQIVLGGLDSDNSLYPTVYIPGNIQLNSTDFIYGTGGSITSTTSQTINYTSLIGNTGSSTGSLCINYSGNTVSINSSYFNIYAPYGTSVYGNMVVQGTVTASNFPSSSDYRIKTNVISLSDSFTVDNLNPVTYFNLNTKKQDIGLIAHELQEWYPVLVNGEKDGDTMQSVNYTGLIPVLIKEIQELKNDIKKIKEEFSFFKNNKIEIKS